MDKSNTEIYSEQLWEPASYQIYTLVPLNSSKESEGNKIVKTVIKRLMWDGSYGYKYYLINSDLGLYATITEESYDKDGNMTRKIITSNNLSKKEYWSHCDSSEGNKMFFNKVIEEAKK